MNDSKRRIMGTDIDMEIGSRQTWETNYGNGEKAAGIPLHPFTPLVEK